MTKLQIYNFEGNDVRAINKDGEPWWVLKDVCDALELTNATIVASRLDEDEVTKFDLGGLSGESNIINESGLYNVILRSNKPKAKAFKRWVTHDVIPSIRKHGVYAVDEMLANPDMMIAALQELKSERERSKSLQLIAAVQKQQITELQPKASYYDLILQNKNTVPITQIAKDYGMSGTAFNKQLHALGIQYKLRNTWLLYQDFADCGYTQSRTYAIDAERSVMHTYWTQKGRLFLYELLKSKCNLLPLVERGAA